ncbi:hypothetical protein ACFE04_010321 [Oxalis oulophora]
MAPSSVVVTIVDELGINNISVLQISNSENDSSFNSADKQETASPKQFTFFIVLRAVKNYNHINMADQSSHIHFPNPFYMAWISFRARFIAPVYVQSIATACQIDWSKDRILIQILDDSDEGALQHLIKDEVDSWHEKGVNIVYRHQFIRTGYKAGNLKSAMSCDYVKDYEFVAIFDADFTPNPDFLKTNNPSL